MFRESKDEIVGKWNMEDVNYVNTKNFKTSRTRTKREKTGRLKLYLRVEKWTGKRRSNQEPESYDDLKVKVKYRWFRLKSRKVLQNVGRVHFD